MVVSNDGKLCRIDRIMLSQFSSCMPQDPGAIFWILEVWLAFWGKLQPRDIERLYLTRDVVLDSLMCAFILDAVATDIHFILA